MNAESCRRKLNKKLDARVRDTDGGTGNAKSFHKAVRRLGRALVDSALEDIAQDEAEAMEPCVMCPKMCPVMFCSKACEDEAVELGLISPNNKQ